MIRRVEPVARIDAGFLFMESRHTTWHVLGILLLDPSTSPRPFDLAGVRRLLVERLPFVEVFHKRLDPLTSVVMPHWVHDDSLDLEAHVLPADLPPDADLDELLAFAGRLASRPLDRSRPLWEMHVAERLVDGRAAVVVKVHHSLVDGISALTVLGILLDVDPEGTPVVPHAEPEEVPSGRGLVDSVTRELAAQPVRAARSLGAGTRALRQLVRVILVEGRRFTGPFLGPRTEHHHRITASRSAAVASIALEDVKVVKAATGSTFTDVVMAVCAGALHDWLAAGHRLPAKPLVASIPTSIRADIMTSGAGASARNQVSSMFVALPTQLDDPLARLRAVHHDAQRAKSLHHELGPTLLPELADAAPWIAMGRLLDAVWLSGVARALPPVVNLLLTTVPGPPIPMYLGGAKVVGMFPLGPIFDGVPLNVSAVSHEDRVDVGIMTCPQIEPTIRGLADAIPPAMAELRAAVDAEADHR